jgi:hypothetical protein
MPSRIVYLVEGGSSRGPNPFSGDVMTCASICSEALESSGSRSDGICGIDQRQGMGNENSQFVEYHGGIISNLAW